MLQAADRTGLAVLAEQAAGERRVALVPRDVEKLAARAAMFVEHGAGLEAGFPDEAYRDAGATLLARGAVLEAADVALAIRPPADLEGLRQGATLISLGAHDADLVAALRNRAVSHLALERLPRITRAQSMDVLSSQATIAGYAAVIEGARMLDTLLPMLTTAAGIIRPARMIALGAGVAGLQAIATARRLARSPMASTCAPPLANRWRVSAQSSSSPRSTSPLPTERAAMPAVNPPSSRRPCAAP